jgi:hypothetical protein
VRSPEGTTLMRIPPKNTGAPHLEARKAEGCHEGKRSKAWLLPGRSTPFLKEDFPTHAPKRHEQSLPRRAPGFPPYDTGARPHMSYRLTQRTKKANHRTRGVQLPAVMRPYIFGATSGREGKLPHKEHATAPRLRAPSSSPKPAVKKAIRHTGSVQPPRG